MSDRSRQVDNLISRLEAQHIQIDPTQAQLLLDATGGDLEMALALYWEDSVAHQAWERQQQQQQAQPGRDNAAKAKAANDEDRPERDNDSDNDRDDNYARARRRVERRQADRRQRNRSKSALNKRGSRRSDGSDGDANDDLNEDDDIGMNNRRNNNRRDANQDNEGDDSDVESLRNHDMELDRDAQNRRRIIAANNRGDENNNNRPGNHVSVSDDETNFNEKFLQRIKNHMKKRKHAGDRYEARLKKKRRLFSWQDKFQRFASEVERSNRSGLGFEDAGAAVLDELIKLSRLGETQRDDNCANGNMQLDDKHNEVDYKPIAKSIENIDDDLSSDEEEENDLDAQYAEALNLLESTVAQPSSILWGGNTESNTSNDSSSQSNQGENDGEKAQGEGSDSRKPQEGVPDESGDRDGDGDDGDGDGDGDGDDDGNTTDAKGSEKKVEIPRTWLSASFNLSKCGTGLVLSKPDETEVARLKSIQNTIFPSGTSSIAPPLPPFHCGAITMLTSLVTALLCSDVSVQGTKIVANSLKRKPFIQLSAEERKKQFNERLADALAAILCIAAESSTKFRLETLSELLKKMKRKQESKKDPDMSDDECGDQGLKDREITMRRVMETRAKLCPVCRWDNTNEEGVDVLDRDCLYMNVSLTNRQDLRAYVVSNIRSFTNPGGCALFLETILHIHGLPRVKRMLQELKESKSGDPLCCFVNCTCEKKLKEEWDDYMQKRKLNPSLRQKDWSLPLCRSCTGSELLSLLLTGKLHQDMSNWFAGTFGIGFLSGSIVEDKNSVHERLKSPDQPIWIVEGKSSYFMLWNNDGKTQTKPLADDSYSFKLNSWNCWTEDIKQEVLSIVPARNIVSDAPTSIIEPITKTELEQTLIHPDDEQNYSNYRRWRFAFNVDQDTSNTPLNWMPFYKLNERQKEIVLRKSNSSVECAIWTKWPKAVVEASVVEH